MMIECSIVVLLQKDLSCKRKKIQVRSPFFVLSGHYILRNYYVIWGKHKSHALSIYKKMGLGDPKPTAIQLLKADGTMKNTYRDTPRCASKSGVVHISGRFCYSWLEVDFEVPIILERPFLAMGTTLGDMEKGQIKFWLNNEEVTFNIWRSMLKVDEA